MERYEKLSYASFMWKFGTTSFRTREFNKMIEWQLRLLDEFWAMPENHDKGWEVAREGQDDIYEIKNSYYDWLVFNGFTKGNDKVKYKAAREKTSGLLDMGLIDNEHRLTDVGRHLLRLSEENGYLATTQLGIPQDAHLYLEQLLKLSDSNTGTVVRPFVIVLYLLTELGHLTNEEFRYLMPLCTSGDTTARIVQAIRMIRDGKQGIDQTLVDQFMSKTNYAEGLNRFVSNDFSEELLLSVSMNRKSPIYDRKYVSLYNEMHAVYVEHRTERIIVLYDSLKPFSSKWKRMMFDTSSRKAVENNPTQHLLELPADATASETAFKRFFYLTMHLNKTKATLEDYFDLNRRYLELTNCFLFEDGQVKLDVVPKHFFKGAIADLYREAYQESAILFVESELEQICPSLRLDEQRIVASVNEELNLGAVTMEDVYRAVDTIRYNRLNKLIDERFSDQTLLALLEAFERRDDEAICQLVTDNADVPTIFEYVLGIIWYKVSNRRGHVLDFMKLSLDANLLPVTHASGGEADIVYEYEKTESYPAHCVLLEATLADGANQRRMEMEPVSRHVGNHILRTGNQESYGIFVTTFLHVNVLSDFKCRKHVPYADSQTFEHYIPGMKITPMDTGSLKNIIRHGMTYPALYRRFENAYQQADNYPNPKEWYCRMVEIPE